MEAPALEDATRQLAAELLVTLCEAREKAPGMMRKLPQFLGRLFQSLLSFLLDIEARTAPQPALADLAEPAACSRACSPSCWTSRRALRRSPPWLTLQNLPPVSEPALLAAGHRGAHGAAARLG